VKTEIIASVSSDAGCVRSSNEDACRVVQPGDAGARHARGVLAIVADGMGGHAAGEVASQLAVDTIHREYYASEGDAGTALTAAVVHANRVIFNRALSTPALHGMGTTCAALALVENTAYASHVGDSRIYLIRGGAIYQMTNDDSAVGGMVRKGLISRSEARRHDERNVLLKALGTSPSVVVSSWPDPLPTMTGDTFVVCSDGLTDLVDDDELQRTAGTAVPSDAAAALVHAAKSRGGFDNITVAILRVAPAGTTATIPATRETEVTA
jgi:protein phosphatase